MKQALKPGGIVCSQGGTYWTDLNHVRDTLNHCRAQFPISGYANVSVPSYPCGQIGFVIGSLNDTDKLNEPKITFSSDEIDKMNLKYYTSDTHRSAFALPRFAEKALYS